MPKPYRLILQQDYIHTAGNSHASQASAPQENYYRLLPFLIAHTSEPPRPGVPSDFNARLWLLPSQWQISLRLLTWTEFDTYWFHTQLPIQLLPCPNGTIRLQARLWYAPPAIAETSQDAYLFRGITIRRSPIPQLSIVIMSPHPGRPV